jgi:membrane protein DedA with SNARE-associated domain
MIDRRLLKPLLLVTIVLVLPLVFLAIRGEAFADALAGWQSNPPPPMTLAMAVVAILASDVLLPIPSGPVSTLAGSQLGAPLGTVVSALGMTLGAVIAFALARRWGRPLAERLAAPETLEEADRACREHGPWMLALTRPLPVLAEAAALLLGMLRMSWGAFLPPVVASNVVIAAAYALLGAQAAERGWLPLALAISVAAPLAVAALVRRRIRH